MGDMDELDGVLHGVDKVSTKFTGPQMMFRSQCEGPIGLLPRNERGTF